MRVKALFILAGAVGLPTPALAQYGFIDGGFEAQGAAVTDSCAFEAQTCPEGVWSGTGLVHAGSAAWGGPQLTGATTFGYVEGSGALTQSFVASSDAIVRLTWFEQQRQSGPGPKTYAVRVNGADLGTFIAQASTFVGRSSGIFQLEAGKTYSIEFLGLAADDGAALIGEVALEAVDIGT